MLHFCHHAITVLKTIQCFCKPALAVLLLLHTSQLWAKERLILLAGQSNMMGRGKTSELPAAYKTTPAAVREQQAAVQQQLPRAFMVSSEGLGKQGDGIHCNAAEQIELGKRFAQAYIQQMH